MKEQHPKMIIDGNYKHPLTYEIAEEIYPHSPDGHEYYCGSWNVHMQAGANWQLEQVIEWLKINTAGLQTDYVGVDYDRTYYLKESFFDDFKKAMRPQDDN